MQQLHAFPADSLRGRKLLLDLADPEVSTLAKRWIKLALTSLTLEAHLEYLAFVLCPAPI